MESGKIYRKLKESIIKLDLAPESVLNLTELSESYEVSRTPIKEALVMLQADGWVLRDGSRFMVTPLSLRLLKETTEIRSVLEVQGNVSAMNRINREELDGLNQLKRNMTTFENINRTSNRQMIELDMSFHRILFQATRNNQLAVMLERLLASYLRFWLSYSHEVEPKSFFSSTLDMIRAIDERDETALRDSSMAHIRESVDMIMSAF